ncbi:N-acetyltransferase [uncultured Hyphomicrobium sp.]|uniref:GNAT family N-acetyltransferase n=1 Tax=uncultured Hyphomicrobium sp. TaxID=194373 RepID=UPI0025F36F39|nr:N-acetyltransferase [uncultured Hyphomicrobium sp.]
MAAFPRIALETPALAPEIRSLLLAAFPTPVEADLVERLRRDGDVAMALAAFENDALVGHVVFSPMAAPFKALGLGPVAVTPKRQRSGIGSQLIRQGLATATDAGWDAIFVLGDPAYYGRFGFRADTAAGFECPYAGPYLMALALSGNELPGRGGSVAYAPAFRDLE